MLLYVFGIKRDQVAPCCSVKRDFTGKEVEDIKKEFSDFLVTWIIKYADNPVANTSMKDITTNLATGKKSNCVKLPVGNPAKI